MLFTVGLDDATFDEARVDASRSKTSERRVVLAGAGFARFVTSGQLLFVRGGPLHAVGFEPERLVGRGTPEVHYSHIRIDAKSRAATRTGAVDPHPTGVRSHTAARMTAQGDNCVSPHPAGVRVV